MLNDPDPHCIDHRGKQINLYAIGKGQIYASFRLKVAYRVVSKFAAGAYNFSLVIDMSWASILEFYGLSHKEAILVQFCRKSTNSSGSPTNHFSLLNFVLYKRSIAP